MQRLFVDYLKADVEPDIILRCLLTGHGIQEKDRETAEAFLAPLKAKGPAYLATRDHSIRVASLGERVAEFAHLDPKVLVFSGLFHDLGKLQVSQETLAKTRGWTDKDNQAIQPHVIDGYRSIRDRFDFSAEVILWHHQFQAQPYPRNMPRPLHDFCAGSKVMIPFYGRLLSLCDQFDAFHRVNDKHGEMVEPTGEEIKELLLKFNRDQRVLLEELYKADIFTTYTRPASVEV